MAAPRIQAPDSGEGSTGNPILDSANALDVDSSATPITLEGNRPAQSSPLKSSMTAADLDSPVSREAPSSAAGGTLQSTSPSASGEQQHQQAGGVENVIAAIGGAAVCVEDSILPGCQPLRTVNWKSLFNADVLFQKCPVHRAEPPL